MVQFQQVLNTKRFLNQIKKNPNDYFRHLPVKKKPFPLSPISLLLWVVMHRTLFEYVEKNMITNADGCYKYCQRVK